MTLDKQLDALDSFYLDMIQQTSALPDGKIWRYPSTQCTLKYVIVDCNCKRRIVPSVCMSLNCKRCKDFVGRRRELKAVHRLLDYMYYWKRSWVKKPVLYTVFTVPPEVRYKYSTKEAWAKIRRKAWQLLKKDFAGAFALEATHPVGDKDKKHFHPHLNFLWKQKTGFRPYLDVVAMRKAWAKILEVEDAEIHHDYTYSIRKILNWVHYVVRTFPGTHKWTGPVRWFGKYPKSSRSDNHYLCPDCGHPVKFIGWLLAEDVERWNQDGQYRGFDPPWERGEFKRSVPQPCGEFSAPKVSVRKTQTMFC